MTYDGLTADDIGHLTHAPLVRIFASIPSVLDTVHALGESGAPSGAIALADEQTAGRGRMGRRWHSPPGAGIWLAVLLRPRSAPQGGALAIRAGLAAKDALEVAAPRLLPSLKWPNDLVIKGRKLGGILCEAHWSGERLGWVAVGVGLNVHGPLPAELAGTAIAIADVDGDVSRLGILEQLVPRLAALVDAPGTLTDVERAAYLRGLWMPAGGDPAVGLDPDGALVERRPDGSLDRRVAPS